MSISYQVLGAPGCDNALHVHVDSGQAINHLLFDCGDGCVSSLPYADVLAIDHLFLSHLHMDHIAGFDAFFRCLFHRENKPNHIWGPVGTADIIHHRFRGFLWNLHSGMNGTWYVHDVMKNQVTTSRFELHEAFATKHEEGTHEIGTTLIDLPTCAVDVHEMNHGTTSLAFIIREKSRSNIETSRLAALGLKPGPWMKQLKSGDYSTIHSDQIVIDGVTHSWENLRKSLITETPGQSIAYLSDFTLDDAALTRMAQALQSCDTLVCESQYKNDDRQLADKNFHMTTGLAAQLANQASVGSLILFHLSDRYHPSEWQQMLAEAREVFPNTSFPANWNL
jgi:ribonuclease Z